jgi:hypothetical protein
MQVYCVTKLHGLFEKELLHGVRRLLSLPNHTAINVTVVDILECPSILDMTFIGTSISNKIVAQE